MVGKQAAWLTIESRVQEREQTAITEVRCFSLVPSRTHTLTNSILIHSLLEMVLHHITHSMTLSDRLAIFPLLSDYPKQGASALVCPITAILLSCKCDSEVTSLLTNAVVWCWVYRPETPLS
jgi:hypothetical protein